MTDPVATNSNRGADLCADQDPMSSSAANLSDFGSKDQVAKSTGNVLS
jgi:hypothetical protein